ncbi:hypothetical protein QVD99_004097 [Batrachochytrium dendrobatidis]|nr:hypothetical protein O5D80_005575 [Batrachochytrium dendrobatidis]KAK5669710.1 hypothetical protein QVD99_004097 [Batrachochytrium dendrobatidis]
MAAPKVTPRTNIVGAHQQNLHVKAGSRLSGKSKPLLAYKRLYVGLAVALPLIMLASDWIPAQSTLGAAKQRLIQSYTALAYMPTGFQAALLIALLSIVYVSTTMGKPYMVFAYSCFIKPYLMSKPNGIDSDQHQQRLEQFYEGQAEIYDVTRRRLLRGRSTMLKLCAAQLRQVYPCLYVNDFQVGRSGETVTDPASLPSPPLSPSYLAGLDRRFAWVDIGGGTGENIERMNQFFPIRNFDKVYLVDITPSLCEVARKRFARLGWTNVTVLCMDAAKFAIPKEDGVDMDIALITMSYSLSMIEIYYPIIDRISEILAPTGIFGISDFYVSAKRSADPTRQLGWFMRWFWAIWFDQDNIYLSPGRREYLEHKFKTVKALNCLNHFIKPFVKIPYYVYVGAQKHAAIPSFALDNDVEADVTTSNTVRSQDDVSDASGDEFDDEVIRDSIPKVAPIATPPPSVTAMATVSADHVHGQGFKWRQPFDPKLLDSFSTYIYAFTWEDPRVDLEYMNIKPTDHMFVISSGGCNVLEYAAKVGPERIHCVDLNPCQNHMLELKLAGLSSMSYEDFWLLFGEGYIPKFSTLLDTHLSPHLSPYAYHFWKQTSGFSNLFKTGCSGLAIRVFQFVIRVRGLRPVVERMCSAPTLEEQNRIWLEELRPHLLSKWLIRILNNDRFLWGALGVPPAQMQMLLQEGSAHEYCVNTLDPVVAKSHLGDDNYFYYMPLMLKYNPNAKGNPAYLTEEGFNILRSEPHRLDAIKIHTDYINNVLNNQVADNELTKVILMDHLDWFSHEDAKTEIETVHKKMAQGGFVYWRSAGKHPWYNEIFAATGFEVIKCQVREGDNMYIDRVNMYASFWSGRKL